MKLTATMKQVMRDLHAGRGPYHSFRGTTRGGVTMAIRALIEKGLLRENRGSFYLTLKAMETDGWREEKIGT